MKASELQPGQFFEFTGDDAKERFRALESLYVGRFWYMNSRFQLFWCGKDCEVVAVAGWDDEPQVVDGYRILQLGEVVEQGDEYICSLHKTWKPAKHTIGDAIQSRDIGEYRRQARSVMTKWDYPFRDYICSGEGVELSQKTISAPSAAVAAEFFIEDAELTQPGTYKVLVKAPNGTMREFLVDLSWEPSASAREVKKWRP